MTLLLSADRTHTLWHQSEKTDHSKQNQTKAVRSWDCSRAKPLALCDHVFICKILPTKKNPYISLSARSVLLLNNQRLCNLLQQYVEVALCLNWIDECIVTAVFIVCLFFLFITLWSYKVYKGKIRQIDSKRSMQLFTWSTVCQCHHSNGTLHPVLSERCGEKLRHWEN